MSDIATPKASELAAILLGGLRSWEERFSTDHRPHVAIETALRFMLCPVEIEGLDVAVKAASMAASDAGYQSRCEWTGLTRGSSGEPAWQLTSRAADEGRAATRAAKAVLVEALRRSCDPVWDHMRKRYGVMLSPVEIA